MGLMEDLAALQRVSQVPNWKPTVDHNRVAEIVAQTTQAPRSTGFVERDVLPAPAVIDPSTWTPRAERDSGGFSPGSLAGDLFSGIIDVVDTPRAAVTSGIKEIWDVFDEGDASLSEWLQQTRDNYDFNDLMRDKDAFQDWNPWIRGGIGFVGNVAADPLTYLAAGTIRGATSASRAAGLGNSPMDVAMTYGTRTGLAKTAAQEAMLRADDIARAGIKKSEVDTFISELGMRGRGAATTKGLKRAGVSPEVPKALGLSREFGYGIRPIVGDASRRAELPFTRRLAEGSENLKGSLKKAFGSSRGSKVFRRLFSGDASPIGSAVRQFTGDVLSGSQNSADAARGLVIIGNAAQDAHPYMDELVNEVSRDFSKLKSLKPEDRRQLVHAIEAGDDDAFDGLAGDIRKWYEKVGLGLKEDGVEFGWQENYVNHMLTERAMRELKDPASNLSRKAEQSLNSAEVFQKTRTLKQGDEWMGEVIPVTTRAGDSASLRSLNDISERQVGHRIFEEDIDELMGAYITQAHQAKFKAAINNRLEEYGLNFRGVAEAKARFDAEVAAKEASMAEASRVRRQALRKAAQGVDKRQATVAGRLLALEAEIGTEAARLQKMADHVSKLESELDGWEASLRFWEMQRDGAVVKGRNVRRAQKSAATKKIKKAEKKIEELQGQAQAARAKYARARAKDKRAALQQEFEALDAEVEGLIVEQSSLQAARDALDSAELPGVAQAETSVAEAAAKKQAVRDEFIHASETYSDASNTFAWVAADADAAGARLGEVIDNLENVKEAAASKGKAGYEELRERTQIALEGLSRAADSLDDQALKARYEAVAVLEAQAAAHDAAVFYGDIVLGDAKREFDRLMGVMGDKEFQQYMERVLNDGLTVLNEKVTAPTWFADAFKRIPRDENNWQALRKALRGYDRALNVWKGMAVTSPGFVFRNFYSGMFNMYLDGVRPANVMKFRKFIHQYHMNANSRGAERWVARNADRIGMDPDVLRQQSSMERTKLWAKANGYDDAELEAIEGALRAASVSGWGLNPQEISTQLVGAKGSWNPFNVEFGPTRSIRNASSNVEALMRGSHAYDVLMRGGTVDQAVDRVTLFHFNYRDVTEFDRAMKRVSPFWVFYSRNMALQAQMWTRYPHKLNRSYFNMKKSMEAQSDPDSVEPGYFDELGAVRTPLGDRDGGTWYFTPDLPSLRFRQDFAQITGTEGEGLDFDPLRMISDTAPAIKVPVEMVAGKELFTDIPFKDRLYDYNADGDMTPRLATDLLQGEIPGTDIGIPVLSEAVPRAASLLPGAEYVNGQLVLTDKTESAIEDFIPFLGRTSRLTPNTEKFEDRRAQSALSFAGVPVRQNTERSIQGELFARNKRAEEEARRQRDRAIIEGLLP